MEAVFLRRFRRAMGSVPANLQTQSQIAGLTRLLGKLINFPEKFKTILLTLLLTLTFFIYGSDKPNKIAYNYSRIE